MPLKYDLAKKLLEEEKWNADVPVYREELLNLLFSVSQGYSVVSDLPPFSEGEDSDIRKFASKLKQSWRSSRRPRSVSNFLASNNGRPGTEFLTEYTKKISSPTPQSPQSAPSGRPPTPFVELSERQKSRIIRKFHNSLVEGR